MANYQRFEVLPATTPLTLTTNYQDLGSEINVENYKQLWVYLDVDINSAQNVTIQATCKGADGNWYAPPFITAGTAKWLVDGATFELNVDADQKQIISIPVTGATHVKLQAKEGTDGGTDAIILYAEALACEWMNT